MRKTPLIVIAALLLLVLGGGAHAASSGCGPTLYRQTNLHASLELQHCGTAALAPGSVAPRRALQTAGQTAADPSEQDIVGTDGTYPAVTQSETQTWAEGGTVVSVFNDSRAAPSCYAGISYSRDGGGTWANISPSPLCSGHGADYGDPAVLYDKAHSKWFVAELVTGCGDQGIGGWTSTDGASWSATACVHSGAGDDRESAWVDNSASSPHYGRIYVSWNDFASNNGALVASHSDDGGTTWTAPAVVYSGAAFLRNVQVKSGPDGTVFVMSMDEGGGQLNVRSNIAFRSTDGGATWTKISMGPSFPAAGNLICNNGDSYFPSMFENNWRYLSWGDLGVGPNGVVSYAFTEHGVGSDAGDVYYTQSADNGSTWSKPQRLDSDTSGTQWQPSVSVSDSGKIFVRWYDTRGSNDSYQQWGRVSLDQGRTWSADAQLSGTSPVPEQPDPNVAFCYAGDYDRSYSADGTSYFSWVDGRNPINGYPQQDVFTGRYDFGDASGFTPLPQDDSPPPSISSISPTSAPLGSQVTIEGSGFTDATRVSFGGATSTSFSIDSDTQISATVPDSAVPGPVTVTTFTGTAVGGDFAPTTGELGLGITPSRNKYSHRDCTTKTFGTVVIINPNPWAIDASVFVTTPHAFSAKIFYGKAKTVISGYVHLAAGQKISATMTVTYCHLAPGWYQYDGSLFALWGYSASFAEIPLTLVVN